MTCKSSLAIPLLSCVIRHLEGALGMAWASVVRNIARRAYSASFAARLLAVPLCFLCLVDFSVVFDSELRAAQTRLDNLIAYEDVCTNPISCETLSSFPLSGGRDRRTAPVSKLIARVNGLSDHPIDLTNGKTAVSQHLLDMLQGAAAGTALVYEQQTKVCCKYAGTVSLMKDGDRS